MGEVVADAVEAPNEGVTQTGQPEFFSAKDSAVIDAEPAEVARRFRPGRPVGSGNVVNKQIAEMCARIMGDDRLALARLIATPVAVLRRELSCTTLEAEQFKLACRKQLWPHIYAEMPKELAVSTKSTALHLHGMVDLKGGTGVDALFALGATEAAREGFDVASLPAPALDEGDSENADNSDS